MSTQENKVCLYIFTHNKTGLRYFGKTIRFFDEESLLKYGGSGIYWNAHIKKHGKDLSVEIYGIYNIDEVEEIAIKFSDYNNITESRNWANLKPENGHDGGNNRIEIIDKETGLSNFQVSSKKAMDTMKNDIVNGKNMLLRKSDKSNRTLGSTGRKERAKKGVESQTRQQLKDKAKKANETLGEKGRRDRALKGSLTKKKTLINGKNLHEIINKKSIETMKNDMVDGKNMLLRRTQKANETKAKKNSDGVSINDIIALKNSNNKIKKSIELYGTYKIITKDNRYEGLIFSMVEIRRISLSLQKTSKHKPMAMKNSAKKLLIKHEKEFLIGSYIKKIKD